MKPEGGKGAWVAGLGVGCCYDPDQGGSSGLGPGVGGGLPVASMVVCAGYFLLAGL
jgi:hypothetical protein